MTVLPKVAPNPIMRNIVPSRAIGLRYFFLSNVNRKYTKTDITPIRTIIVKILFKGMTVNLICLNNLASNLLVTVTPAVNPI